MSKLVLEGPMMKCEPVSSCVRHAHRELVLAGMVLPGGGTYAAHLIENGEPVDIFFVAGARGVKVIEAENAWVSVVPDLPAQDFDNSFWRREMHDILVTILSPILSVAVICLMAAPFLPEWFGVLAGISLALWGIQTVRRATRAVTDSALRCAMICKKHDKIEGFTSKPDLKDDI